MHMDLYAYRREIAMMVEFKARRKLIASEPMRPRLLNAAAVGPVALDVIVSYESLGYAYG